MVGKARKLPWDEVKLRDIATTCSGGTPSRNVPEYYGGNIPWVKSGEVNHEVITETEESISDAGLKNSSAKWIEAGSILVAMYGATAGVIARLEIDATINQAILAVNGKQNRVHNRFLYYALKTLVPQLLRSVQGSGQPNLNGQIIGSLKVPLPPVPEQKKIAEILSTWDDAIATVSKLIESKRALKKGLMQQLLTGKRRFPGFVVKPGSQKTKYGSIPADWDYVRISDIADVNAMTLSNSTPPGYEFSYVDLASVKEGIIDFPSSQTVFESSPSRARRVLRQGDIIMATVRPYLKGFALADFDTEDIICSTGFALISPHRSEDSRLIYESLYTDLMSRQLHALLVGSNYPAINGSDVENLRLFYPTKPEERSWISNILTDIGTEIHIMIQLADRLISQKRGLMQKLLTGMVRVKVDEEVSG